MDHKIIGRYLINASHHTAIDTAIALAAISPRRRSTLKLEGKLWEVRANGSIRLIMEGV